MDKEAFDLIIIGAGPSGVSAAFHAASNGMNVAVVNGGGLLGYALQGAYKSKGMYELAMERIAAMKIGHGHIPCGNEVSFDEINRQLGLGSTELTDVYLKYLKHKEIRVIDGMARFSAPDTIEVNGNQYSAGNFIVATGSMPRPLPGVDMDSPFIMTSDDIVDIKRGFNSLLIIGAGVIGCEFASIFAALGVDVTLIDTANRLLSSEDYDISEHLASVFKTNGINIKADIRTKSVTVEKGKVKTELTDGEIITSDRVLLAIGRTACTQNLGLEKAGIETNQQGAIRVNSCLQTSVSHIYAVGDVAVSGDNINLALAHVAEAEGRTAVKHMLGEDVNFRSLYVPYIIFTVPMIAGAGLNEIQARKIFGSFRMAKIGNIRNHRYHAMRSHEGFLKLIVGPPGDDRILGVRAIGHQADNVTGEAAVLIDNKIPYTYLLDSMHAHPSLSESLQNAARVIAGIMPANM